MERRQNIFVVDEIEFVQRNKTKGEMSCTRMCRMI